MASQAGSCIITKYYTMRTKGAKRIILLEDKLTLLAMSTGDAYCAVAHYYSAIVSHGTNHDATLLCISNKLQQCHQEAMWGPY